MEARNWLAWASGRKAYALVSLLPLAPCYWQPRLQAGDLSGLINTTDGWRGWSKADVQGLAIASRWTNVLFDSILRGLFRALGAEAAQRISVSIAVLISPGELSPSCRWFRGSEPGA